MKKRKKLISFVVTFIFLFSLINMNVMASDSNQSVTPNTTGTSYSVGYKIYDADGNLREKGTLPISEEAAAAEPTPAIDHPARTLINGELMILDTRGYGPVIVYPGTRITLSFGLNRNTSMFAGIYNTVNNTYIKEWAGFTGGLSIGATSSTNTNVVGHIVNRSSDPVTVTWATINTGY